MRLALGFPFPGSPRQVLVICAARLSLILAVAVIAPAATLGVLALARAGVAAVVGVAALLAALTALGFQLRSPRPVSLPSARSRGNWAGPLAAAGGVTLVMIGWFSVVQPAVQPPVPGPGPPPTPARIVVLVDESGSVSSEDLEREREAARLIAQGELAPRSVVAVAGFGGGRVGVSPVDPVCPPTSVDTARNRQFLTDCIGQLRRRTAAEGNGTDHVSALRHALSLLEPPGTAGEPKIVFLLTDGRLDVSDDPSYGPDQATRNAVAREQLSEVLAELGAAQVQVWPLGFGDVDREQLAAMAAGGDQQGCGPGGPTPAATVIASSADLLGAVHEAFGRARCLRTAEFTDGGEGAEIFLRIPAGTSDGTVLVFKGDPRIVVSYVDPTGVTVPTNGIRGSSRFETTGQNSDVESLRITDPVPGEWRIGLGRAGSDPLPVITATAVFRPAVVQVSPRWRASSWPVLAVCSVVLVGAALLLWRRFAVTRRTGSR